MIERIQDALRRKSSRLWWFAICGALCVAASCSSSEVEKACIDPCDGAPDCIGILRCEGDQALVCCDGFVEVTELCLQCVERAGASFCLRRDPPRPRCSTRTSSVPKLESAG